MSVLSDKYVAGFLDGDGSITVAQDKYLWLEFHQKLDNGGIIELISQRFPGGGLHVRKGKRRGTTTYARRLVYTGQRAVDLLCRLKPHLVTKRVRANRLLRELGFIERVGTDSVPVHPSRKWLAGYFDGDGCISASVNKHGGTATMRFFIDTESTEKDGIELVQKAFGGTVRRRQKTQCWRWELKADAAKATAFLSYFAKHLVLKQEQAYFVLGCAEMGHFRDGLSIDNMLKVMKTHPHRLNDMASEVDVSAELAAVRNLQPASGVRYRHAIDQVCACGSTALYAKGMCNPCWQRSRYVPTRMKRQSELALS